MNWTQSKVIPEKLPDVNDSFFIWCLVGHNKQINCLCSFFVQLFRSRTWRLVIWKVPFSIKLTRPSFPRILWPSFSHWMLGMGLPMMWQCNWVVEPGAKVWLAGPWRMMGGTRSEGAIKTQNKFKITFSTETLYCYSSDKNQPQYAEYVTHSWMEIWFVCCTCVKAPKTFLFPRKHPSGGHTFITKHPTAGNVIECSRSHLHGAHQEHIHTHSTRWNSHQKQFEVQNLSEDRTTDFLISVISVYLLSFISK